MWEHLQPILYKHWSEITLSLGGIGTYLLGRKHVKKTGENEEVKGELENVDTALVIYRKMIDALGEDLKKLNESYKDLQINFTIATDKIEAQNKKIESLSKENRMLRDAINICEKKCELKTSINETNSKDT